MFGVVYLRHSLRLAYWATILMLSFLVELFHDILCFPWHDSYGSPLSNKLLLDDQTFSIALALRDRSRFAPLRPLRNKGLQTLDYVPNNALKRHQIGVKEPAVQPTHVATALDDAAQLDAVFAMIANRADHLDTDTGLSGLDASQCPSFDAAYQRGQLNSDPTPTLWKYTAAQAAQCPSFAAGYRRLGYSKPVSKVTTNRVLKELNDKLNGLSPSRGVPDGPLKFKYLLPFKGGFVLIGRSKSTFSFWVHAPTTPGPSSTAGAGRGKASRGGRRTAAGVNARGRGSRGGRGGRGGGKGLGIGIGGTDPGGDDGDPSDDENKDNGANEEDEDVPNQEFYACPFYKFDPGRHFRCYRKYELRRYSDVKQHILRCHSLGGLYCTRCWRTWKQNQETQWEAHTRTCFQQVPEPEQLRPSEATALNDLVFGHMSDENKWYMMWDLLFVNHPRPDSPKMNCGPVEFLWLLAEGREQVEQRLLSLLLPIQATINHPETLHNFAGEMHAIFSFPFTSDRVQRYRRQHFIDQQQQQAQQAQLWQAFQAQQQVQIQQAQLAQQAQAQQAQAQQAQAQQAHIDPGLLFGPPPLPDMEHEFAQFLNTGAFDYDTVMEAADELPGPPQPPAPPAPHGS